MPGILRRMKYQYRVVGLLSLLAIITYLDRVCIAVAGPRMQDWELDCQRLQPATTGH